MNVGKIYKYDGVVGEIVTTNEKYTFSYNGLEEKVKIDDIVSFNKKSENSDIAIDIKKYENKNLKTLLKEYKNTNSKI